MNIVGPGQRCGNAADALFVTGLAVGELAVRQCRPIVDWHNKMVYDLSSSSVHYGKFRAASG